MAFLKEINVTKVNGATVPSDLSGIGDGEVLAGNGSGALVAEAQEDTDTIRGFNILNANATVTATAALDEGTHGVVQVKGASADVTLTLPDTTGLAVGTAFAISRDDANAVTIAREDAADLLNGATADFSLPNNSSVIVVHVAAGEWQVF